MKKKKILYSVHVAKQVKPKRPSHLRTCKKLSLQAKTSNMSHSQWEFECSNADLEHLREWLKKMPHIVQDYDDNFLAAFVRGCKGSLQKTKNVLENFNALGFRYSYLAGDLDPLNPKLQEHLSVAFIFPTEKRLKDGTIVQIALLNPEKFDDSKFHGLEIVRHAVQSLFINLWENTFGPGKLVLIMDCKNSSITHFKDMTPVVMRDLIQILKTSLPVRPKALHLINLSPSVAAVFNLLKSLSPEKFKTRMFFHSSVKTLYDYIPREILPKEYGGDEGNVSTLSSRWKNKIESYRNRFIEENLKMRRLDSIRPKSDNMDGRNDTFIALNID